MSMIRSVVLVVLPAVAALPAAATPAAHAAPARPDLAVTALKLSGQTVTVGSLLRVNHTARNRGSGAARRSGIGFFLSVDTRKSKTDIRLGSATLKRLGVRKAAVGSKRVSIPALTPAGSYYLLACADAHGKLKETSERNNCRASKRLNVLAPAATTVLGGATTPAGATVPGGDTPSNTTPTGGGTLTPAEPAPPAPTAPSAPSGLTATPDATGHVALTWAASNTASGYRVLRGTASGGPYTEIATPATPGHTDSGRPDMQRFFYVVQAVNDVGTSSNSSEVSALGCVDAGADNSAGGATHIGVLTNGTSYTWTDSVCRFDEDWIAVTAVEGKPSAPEQMKMDLSFAPSTVAPGPAGELVLRMWPSPASNTDFPAHWGPVAATSAGPAVNQWLWGENDGVENGTSDNKSFLFKIVGTGESSNRYTLTYGKPLNGG